MGKARGKANGEVWRARKAHPGRTGKGRARGRLGKVPRYGRSELGKYFGIVVREEMGSQGYLQCGLAKVAGVSESELSLLLNAKHSVLLQTAECVADALGFKVEVLIARARVLMEAAQREAARRQEAQLQAVHAAVSAALKS